MLAAQWHRIKVNITREVYKLKEFLFLSYLTYFQSSIRSCRCCRWWWRWWRTIRSQCITIIRIDQCGLEKRKDRQLNDEEEKLHHFLVFFYIFYINGWCSSINRLNSSTSISWIRRNISIGVVSFFIMSKMLLLKTRRRRNWMNFNRIFLMRKDFFLNH